jgi:hypothetical protein
VIFLSPDEFKAASMAYLNQRRRARGLPPFDENRLQRLVVEDLNPGQPAEE